MSVLKRTYALPEETVAAFERAVRPGRRSMTVATLMHEWLEEATRHRLRQEIVAGLADMREEYLAVERDFHALEEEVERGSAR